MSRTVTGTASAFVHLDGGRHVIVRRGETLPADVSEDELDRLDQLGVFDPPRARTVTTSDPPAEPGEELPVEPPPAATPEEVVAGTVDQVLVHLDAHPEQAADLLAAEQAGRARRSLVDALERHTRPGQTSG